MCPQKLAPITFVLAHILVTLHFNTNCAHPQLCDVVDFQFVELHAVGVHVIESVEFSHFLTLQDIYTARAEGELMLEEELFQVLVSIYRSPAVLFELTRRRKQS